MLPFAPARSLPQPAPYRMRLRDGAEARPQLARFAAWLREEAAATRERLEAMTAPSEAGGDRDAQS